MKKPGLLDPGSEGYELTWEVVIDENDAVAAGVEFEAG
jgi:hypothetical protein